MPELSPPGSDLLPQPAKYHRPREQVHHRWLAWYERDQDQSWSLILR